jgi:transketolase
MNNLSKEVRKDILILANLAKENGAHIGSSLSIVEILLSLYKYVLKYNIDDLNWEERDRFILSKGHGALAYYSVLSKMGFFSKEELYTFEKNGGDFPAQPIMNISKGIEISSGSLGLGLSIGIGCALSAIKKNKQYKTFVLMGDGEINEGSVWEAAMSASSFKLNSLIAIIDKNDMQSDGFSNVILNMGDIKYKWDSFGWNTCFVDGHDINEIVYSIRNFPNNDKPNVLIAKTIKGKGISFMENKAEWHHSILTDSKLNAALLELKED